MSVLYGEVSSNTNTGRTAGGSQWIAAWVQTSEGRVTVNLAADGSFTMRLGPANQPGSRTQRLLYEGTVRDRIIPPNEDATRGRRAGG